MFHAVSTNACVAHTSTDLEKESADPNAHERGSRLLSTHQHWDHNHFALQQCLGGYRPSHLNGLYVRKRRPGSFRPVSLRSQTWRDWPRVGREPIAPPNFSGWIRNRDWRRVIPMESSRLWSLCEMPEGSYCIGTLTPQTEAHKKSFPMCMVSTIL